MWHKDQNAAKQYYHEGRIPFQKIDRTGCSCLFFFCFCFFPVLFKRKAKYTDEEKNGQCDSPDRNHVCSKGCGQPAEQPWCNRICNGTHAAPDSVIKFLSLADRLHTKRINERNHQHQHRNACAVQQCPYHHRTAFCRCSKGNDKNKLNQVRSKEHCSYGRAFRPICVGCQRRLQNRWHDTANCRQKADLCVCEVFFKKIDAGIPHQCRVSHPVAALNRAVAHGQVFFHVFVPLFLQLFPYRSVFYRK